jgi:outer membrane protein assembly factor BamB
MEAYESSAPGSTGALQSCATGSASALHERVAARVAAVALVFSLIVSSVLLYDFSRREAKDPAEAAALRALRAALRQHPDSEPLKEEIRATDQRLREEYFRQRAFALVGAGLLAGGVLIFLAAARLAATIARPLPSPQPAAPLHDWDSAWRPKARWGVATLGLFLVGVTVVLGVTLQGHRPAEPETAARNASSGELSAAASPAVPAAAYTPSEAEIRAAWPRFRGPDGSGISPYENVPESWDGPSGKNIRWKTAVSLPGNNSPVVCGRRVFLSGADATHRRVYGFDAADGRLLWQQDVPGTPHGAAVKVNGDAGFAASTVATDGRCVAAIFANGDVAAFDFDGHLAWSRSLGVPDNTYGHAASLAVYGHLLIIPMDQATADAGRSVLLVVDMATGKTVWQKPRPVAASWSTPIVIHAAGRDQLITTAAPWVIAYDPHDGTELWRVKCLQADVAPSAVFADGLVYAPGNDMAPLCAIRPDGKGDVTATHIVWKAEDNLPDTATPLATPSYVFVITSGGMVTSFDAKKGDKLWEEDLGEIKFKASPSLVGRHLVLVGDDGKGWILEGDHDKCKRIGQTNLGEPCVASPAFQDGRIYFRGEKHLFCIAAPPAVSLPAKMGTVAVFPLAVSRGRP